MKPCKLYEIPNYENRKATQSHWREGEYIHMVGGIFLNAVGNNGNDKDWNSPVWIQYEEPKDDCIIEELPKYRCEWDDVGNAHDKINEIIRHINKEKNGNGK